jgi:L-serine dehydratase
VIGLVQIPCIEQYNGCNKSYKCRAELALESDPKHAKVPWTRWSTLCGKLLRTWTTNTKKPQGRLAVAVNMSDC